MKLNVKLARAEHTAAQFKALLDSYIDAFKSKQRLFQGKKLQYQAAPDQEDMPSMRGNEIVQSTVIEYLAYFEKITKDFINDRFSIEATNASGPKADLIIEEQVVARLSTCELLRLNDFLNNAEIFKMLQTLPVRLDTKSWRESPDPEYSPRGIFETEERELQNKTTIKGSRILQDPNLGNLKGNMTYIPQVVPEDKSVILGVQTMQEFSGELSHRERAEILRRWTIYKAAVKEALTLANDTPVVESEMTSEKLFGYIFRNDLT